MYCCSGYLEVLINRGADLYRCLIPMTADTMGLSSSTTSIQYEKFRYRLSRVNEFGSLAATSPQVGPGGGEGATGVGRGGGILDSTSLSNEQPRRSDSRPRYLCCCHSLIHASHCHSSQPGNVPYSLLRIRPLRLHCCTSGHGSCFLPVHSYITPTAD